MANPIPPHQPIPLERSIRWVPVGSRLPPDVDIAAMEEHAIFIRQGALREIADHARSGADEEVLGFLLGERYECPDSGMHYAVIDTVVRTGHLITEADPVQIPNEEWLGIQLEVRRRHLTLIGWYHSSPFVAPSPARLDLDTQRTRFPEPWQCGLVIATGERPAGGFFRALAATPDTPGGAPSGAFIPFHELLDDTASSPTGARRTLIDWQNYTTDADVELDESASLAASPPAPPGAPGAAPPVLIPMRAEEEDDDPGAPPPRPPRRTRALWPAALVLVVAAVVAVWLASSRRTPDLFPPGTASARDTTAALGGTTGARAPIPIPGGVRPAPPATAPSTSTAPAAQPSSNPSLARFDRLADSLQQTMSNYRTRRSDFDLHRIDCAGLARGYRAADDALVALAALYRDVHGELTANQISRFNQLGAGMDSLNADFGRSRCPRP